MQAIKRGDFARMKLMQETGKNKPVGGKSAE